jgi:hypothetical protein
MIRLNDGSLAEKQYLLQTVAVLVNEPGITSYKSYLLNVTPRLGAQGSGHAMISLRYRFQYTYMLYTNLCQVRIFVDIK